jgi:hypothetical protein
MGTVVLRRSEDLPELYEYLTLSHMWGNHPENQVRLLESNFDEFAKSLPLDRLSWIYRAALQMTIGLGYRYLWIDSLCIIQDSAMDWTREAIKMASVYNNALCNISALFPPESASTPTISRKGKSPCVLRVAENATSGVTIRPVTENYRARTDSEGYPLHEAPQGLVMGSRDFDQGWHWLDKSTWPLYSRAWTLQEQILCRRNIMLYGSKHLLWECGEISCDEVAGEFRYLQSAWDRPSKSDFVSSNESTHGQDTRTLWRRVVRDYSLRSITQEDDMPMALAGVSRVFARMYGLTYVAGLFVEHMPAALMWRVGEDSISPSERVGGHSVAPSWSWLSIPAESREQLFLNLSTPGHEPTASTSFEWDGSSAEFGTDASFHDFDCLQLTLRAATFNGSITKGHPKMDLPTDTFSNIDLTEFFLDTPWNERTATLDVLVAAIMSYESSDWFAASCLVLSADGREEHWRRIGTCELSFKFRDDSQPVPGQLVHLLKGRQRELSVV